VLESSTAVRSGRRSRTRSSSRCPAVSTEEPPRSAYFELGGGRFHDDSGSRSRGAPASADRLLRRRRRPSRRAPGPPARAEPSDRPAPAHRRRRPTHAARTSTGRVRAHHVSRRHCSLGLSRRRPPRGPGRSLRPNHRQGVYPTDPGVRTNTIPGASLFTTETRHPQMRQNVGSDGDQSRSTLSVACFQTDNESGFETGTSAWAPAGAPGTPRWPSRARRRSLQTDLTRCLDRRERDPSLQRGVMRAAWPRSRTVTRPDVTAGPRNSPSRLRFRPLSRLTVRFRVELRRSARDEGWQGVRRLCGAPAPSGWPGRRRSR
jgi:hypothetical protein